MEQSPALTALYQELQSAIISLAAMHRAIAAHPDATRSDLHRCAADALDRGPGSDLVWFCGPEEATHGR